MIRLSKMADYGIVLLAYVAQGELGQVCTARDLAQASGLPMPTVAKVVKTLARAGLLVSHRGVHGGYSLARSADAISVVDVIDAMEGPVAMTACTRPRRRPGASLGCGLLATCPTRGAWAQINRRVKDALSTMTLHEMRAFAGPLASPAVARRPAALAQRSAP